MENADTLKMFDSVQLDKLDEQRERLSISTLLHVTPKGLYLSNAFVQETPLASTQGRSSEIVKYSARIDVELVHAILAEIAVSTCRRPARPS
jgi:hypothetical protein